MPTLVAYDRGFVLWSNDPAALGPRLDVYRKQMELVAMMHKAGVPIMAGTDFSDWALVPGIDLHNELELLVECGFTPLEALQTATLNPAKFLGKTDTDETIHGGARGRPGPPRREPTRRYQPHTEDQRSRAWWEVLPACIHPSTGAAKHREAMIMVRLRYLALLGAAACRPSAWTSKQRGRGGSSARTGHGSE